MGEPKCIYCGTSKDLSDSDIIPDALTASRIINKCVCHVEHNSGMTKKFESEVAEKLAFLLNYLNIKSKKSNHFPTYEADYVIAGIRYHDKKVVKEHDFINKKILWSENNESAFGPYEKIEQIAKSKKTNKGDIEQIDINTQVIESHIPLKDELNVQLKYRLYTGNQLFSVNTLTIQICEDGFGLINKTRRNHL